MINFQVVIRPPLQADRPFVLLVELVMEEGLLELHPFDIVSNFPVFLVFFALVAELLI